MRGVGRKDTPFESDFLPEKEYRNLLTAERQMIFDTGSGYLGKHLIFKKNLKLLK